MKPKSILVHAAFAGLMAGAAIPANLSARMVDEGKCWGVNSCKGKAECATKDHSCAGMNACKGQGWIKLTEKDCKARSGKFEPGATM